MLWKSLVVGVVFAGAHDSMFAQAVKAELHKFQIAEVVGCEQSEDLGMACKYHVNSVGQDATEVSEVFHQTRPDYENDLFSVGQTVTASLLTINEKKVVQGVLAIDDVALLEGLQLLKVRATKSKECRVINKADRISICEQILKPIGDDADSIMVSYLLRRGDGQYPNLELRKGDTAMVLVADRDEPYDLSHKLLILKQKTKA